MADSVVGSQSCAFGSIPTYVHLRKGMKGRGRVGDEVAGAAQTPAGMHAKLRRRKAVCVIIFKWADLLWHPDNIVLET